MAKRKRKKNPFWSKNYIKRPSDKRWTYRDWAIEFYDLGDGTVQAVGYSPPIVKAHAAAYKTDPKANLIDYIDVVDPATGEPADFHMQRAKSGRDAANLVAAAIDYLDFLENKVPSEQVGEDIHTIYTEAVNAAHEVIERVGAKHRSSVHPYEPRPYEAPAALDMRRMRGLVARELEQRLGGDPMRGVPGMRSAQRQYQGKKKPNVPYTLRDFFYDIQPSSARIKWVERAINTAHLQRDTPPALDAENMQEWISAEAVIGSDGRVKRSLHDVRREIVDEADAEAQINPSHHSASARKPKAKPRKPKKKRGPTAASVIRSYMRG